MQTRTHLRFNSDLRIGARGRLGERVYRTEHFRFGGRKISKCACSELIGRSCSHHRTPP